jgi:ribosomal protein L31
VPPVLYWQAAWCCYRWPCWSLQQAFQHPRQQV